MARLIYSAIISLDGYVADEEAHTFINDLERPVGTCSSRPSWWEAANGPSPTRSA